MKYENEDLMYNEFKSDLFSHNEQKSLQLAIQYHIRALHMLIIFFNNIQKILFSKIKYQLIKCIQI